MKLLLFCLVGFVAVAARPGSPAAALIHARHDAAKGKVLVTAHRADWRAFPENSLAGIRSAIEMGVDIVEIDVHRTKDGVLVLMHDETLDRTTTGHGLVANHTWAELQTLHLRDGLGVPTSHVIPKLDEALLAVRGRAMINLDKCYPYLAEAMTVLERTGTVKDALFKSDEPLERVRAENGAHLDRVAFMPVLVLDLPESREILHGYLAGAKPVAFELIFSDAPADLADVIARIHHAGARVWVNSLWPQLCAGHDDERAVSEPDAAWGWLLAQGADIIQTDRPALVLAYLQARGRR